MKINVRNPRQGTIRMMKRGPLNTEVLSALMGGAEIVSIVTTQSAENRN